MSLNRYAKKRDSNESEIIQALTDVGAYVIKLDRFDLLVAFMGGLFALEVKVNEKAKVTKIQREDSAEFAKVGTPYTFVYSPEDALKAIGAME